VKDLKSLKHELQNIICGTGSHSEYQLVKTTQYYLRAGTSPGNDTKTEQCNRAEEERTLILTWEIQPVTANQK
jgi:hypothetical protein